MNPNLTCQEKVAARYPKSKLRNVLYWLASAADHEDGTGIWISLDTLADRASVSIRTAQRHLRELEARGDVITHFQKSGYRTNLYSIPICKDISKRQYRLPLVQRDHSETEIGVTPVENFNKIVTLRGGMQLKLRASFCHPTLKDLNYLKPEEGRVTELSTTVFSEQDSMAFKAEPEFDHGSDETVAISFEAERELASLVSVMRVSRDTLRSGRRTTLTPSGDIFDAPTQS